MSLFDRGPTATCPKCGQRARVRKIAELEAAWYQSQLPYRPVGNFFEDSTNHDYIGGWRGAGMSCSVCSGEAPKPPAPIPRTDAEMLALLATLSTAKKEKG